MLGRVVNLKGTLADLEQPVVAIALISPARPFILCVARPGRLVDGQHIEVCQIIGVVPRIPGEDPLFNIFPTGVAPKLNNSPQGFLPSAKVFKFSQTSFPLECYACV